MHTHTHTHTHTPYCINGISTLICQCLNVASQKLACKLICITSTHSPFIVLQRNHYSPNNSTSVLSFIYNVWCFISTYSSLHIVWEGEHQPPFSVSLPGQVGSCREGLKIEESQTRPGSTHCAAPCDCVCVCPRVHSVSPGAGTVPCCSRLWAILDGLCC